MYLIAGLALLNTNFWLIMWLRMTKQLPVALSETSFPLIFSAYTDMHLPVGVRKSFQKNNTSIIDINVKLITMDKTSVSSDFFPNISCSQHSLSLIFLCLPSFAL